MVHGKISSPLHCRACGHEEVLRPFLTPLEESITGRKIVAAGLNVVVERSDEEVDDRLKLARLRVAMIADTVGDARS